MNIVKNPMVIGGAIVLGVEAAAFGIYKGFKWLTSDKNSNTTTTNTTTTENANKGGNNRQAS
jgi:hypothetical protein